MRERWIALAGLLALTAVGCQGATPAPLFLGHVANLTGSDAAGRHEQQGISLALKQLTDKDLAEALAGRPLKIRHTDTRGDLDAYESEAVRLVSVNRVIGLIGGSTPAEVGRLDRVQVPLLALGGTRPPGATEMVFAIGMRPAAQAFALAQALPAGIRDVVVLADERRDDFMGAADAFARQLTQFRQSQNKPVALLQLRFGKDTKWDELAQTIARRPSLGAVYFAGAARDWLALCRHQAVTAPLIFGGDDGDAANLQGELGKETAYFATTFAPDREAPRTQAFVQQYREAFREEPDVAAALAYEALQLYADALKQIAPTFTAADKLAGALREVKDFAGLAGTLTMKEQTLARPLYVIRMDGAKREVLRRFPPEALP